MALSDIFTPSVIISLAISLLLVGFLGMYVTQKLAQQNHKISSMFELVSTLANEVQMMRGQNGGVPIRLSQPLGQIPVVAPLPEPVQQNKVNVKLISVSDDEQDDDADADDEQDEDDEEDDEDDEEDDDDDINDTDHEVETDSEHEDEDDSDNGSEHDDEEPQVEELDEEIKVKKINLEDMEELHIEEDASPDFDSIMKSISAEDYDGVSSFKNLDIDIDYKKASLTKLRSLAVEKGFVEDASKMKKPELLKLFE